MKMPVKHILTYAGTAPFVLSALALWSGVAIAQLTASIVMPSYGLLILSFVAGTHWGYVAREEEASKVTLALLVSSNVAALLAWGFYLLLSKALMLPLLALLFCALLLIDYCLKRKELVSDGYYRMRRNVTLIVCLCLIVAALRFIYPTA